MQKKVAFYTLGCKVNQYETNAMIEQFIKANYELVDFEDKSDIYIINTCTVTNMSDRKSRQMIRKAKQLNSNSIVVAVGCYAQVSKEKLEEIEAYICSLLTETILNAIGFFVTFLIVSIGVAILCFTLDIISKLPVLHQINTLSGAIAGALEGLVLVWIGFIIITMLGSTTFGQEALGLITESELLSYLYNNNILSRFILK